MVDKLRLSHTSLETYKLCGYKYYLHYREKLRDTTIGSALFFGSALDSAVEILLLSKKSKLTEKEQEKLKLNPSDVFVKKLTYVLINNQIVDIRKSTKAYYFKSDFDIDLITDDAIKELIKSGYSKELNKTQIKDFIEECYSVTKQGNKLPEHELQLFNYINWLSLKQKGLLLLKAYEEQVIPNVLEVYEIQKTVKLEDEDGNILAGYIDFIADWKNEGKVVFDNKTSSKRYSSTSVRESQQLTIYGENEEHFKAGFIVMLKSIKLVEYKKCNTCNNITTRKVNTCAELIKEKRCNGTFSIDKDYQVEIQIIIDELIHEEQEKIFKDIGKITANIKADKFEKNWDSCFSYGRRCAFYDYCRNGSKEGLVELKDNGN